MPNIYDNIHATLLDDLQEQLATATRADFCVGYFNLRGWRGIADRVDAWEGGGDACCRVIIGMPVMPRDEVRRALRLRHLGDDASDFDQGKVPQMRQRIAADFREQLGMGAPTNADEETLQRLSGQLRAGKVVVKLFLRYPLHAKLYLVHQRNRKTPIIGYVGSSNLTFSGLQGQGELNVDVVEGDAAQKLQEWFDARWGDRFCLDISTELADIIDESWARPEVVRPYYIYLKMAYHLAQEARAGLSEFRVPKDFGNQLFDYQTAAVQIAAQHLNKRGGVLIGDVVGLGKTLMATALARVFQDDYGWDTLIICPKNLHRMWEEYCDHYQLRAKIVPLSQVDEERMTELRRYRLVLIDESHNLRNREGKRYRALRDYIERNESKCILLTATPYNKTYLDLSAQLRLFIPEDRDLGVRPERLLDDLGEALFRQRFQCGPSTLAGFEKSEYIDDWRELMRLFMVRRTRSFIQANYTSRDADGQPFLRYANGDPAYFPQRVPHTIPYTVNEADDADPYARLFADEVVTTINALYLPRYGLGNYITTKVKPRPEEKISIDRLSRARDRLRGFCRTNLFKRLESGGPAFLQSIERHCLRNFIFITALEAGKDIPLGTQEAELLDPVVDRDADAPLPFLDAEGEPEAESEGDEQIALGDEASFRGRAAAIYAQYATRYRGKFRWLRASLFTKDLHEQLLRDARDLLGVLARCGAWDPTRDAKLNALVRLLTERHPEEKVLIFTQFADTVDYLAQQLAARGIRQCVGVTGDAADPTEVAWRFSPRSNGKTYPPEQTVRVLVATDVLSEGQNLQDCAIIVNYDLPWAIIRLIQRAGRVDRIGQLARQIRCYSFLPAEGVERILRLRARVRERLQQNAQVVGTDEAFFEGDTTDQPLLDLYHEKAGLLDDVGDGEVDLTSYAHSIWKTAIEANPALEGIVGALPPVVYAARDHQPTPLDPEGVLVYLRTADGHDALARVDARDGHIISQAQRAILDAAACSLTTPGLPRDPRHHALVSASVRDITRDAQFIGGQLGSKNGPRYRTYHRLRDYLAEQQRGLWSTDAFWQALAQAVDAIHDFPLRESTRDRLIRQLKAGISVDDLARMVVSLHETGELCIIDEERDPDREPQIICSLGLFAAPTP